MLVSGLDVVLGSSNRRLGPQASRRGNLDLPLDDRHLRLEGAKEIISLPEGRDQFLRRLGVRAEIAMEGRPSALVFPQRPLLVDEIAEPARLMGEPVGRVTVHHTSDLAEAGGAGMAGAQGPTGPERQAEDRWGYGDLQIYSGGNAVSRTSSATRTKGAVTASLLLRLTVGPVLVFHGYSKIFGGGGLGGTATYFEKLGLRPGILHAGLGAGTEIGAGTLMTVGALSPLPAAGAIGLMATAARTDHKGKGLLVFKGGWEYTGVLAAAAAAVAALGPGPWSVDRVRGKERSGPVWALLALAVGLGGAAAILSRVKPEPAEKALAT